MNLRLLAGASKPGLGPAAELLLALPKSNQKASPCTPPVSSSARVARAENKSPESCADAQPVGSWFSAWTAQHCALRGGVKGRTNATNDCFAMSVSKPGFGHLDYTTAGVGQKAILILGRCCGAILTLTLSACASVGVAPVPYSQQQDGARQPFGFLVGKMPDDRTYIEFQGSPLVNSFEEMEQYVLNKAREVCSNGLSEIRLSRGLWFVNVNALGRPALGLLPTTGRTEAFPKVSGDVQCK